MRANIDTLRTGFERIAPLAVVGALTLGACSSDGSESSDTTEVSAPTTAEADQTIDFCANDSKLPLDQENLGNNTFPAAFGKNLAELTQEEEAQARSFYAEQAATNDFSASVISVLNDRVNSVAYAEDVANEILRTVKDASSSEVKSEEYCNDATRAIQSSTFFELGGQLTEVVPLYNQDGSYLGTGLIPIVIEDSFTVLGKRDVNGTTYGTDENGKTYIIFGDGSGLTEVKAVLDAPLEAKVKQEESDVQVSSNDQQEDNQNATGADKNNNENADNNQTEAPAPGVPEAPAPGVPEAPAPGVPEAPAPTPGTTLPAPIPGTSVAPPTTQGPLPPPTAPPTTGGTLPPPTAPPTTGGTLPPPPTTSTPTTTVWKPPIVECDPVIDVCD